MGCKQSKAVSPPTLPQKKTHGGGAAPSQSSARPAALVTSRPVTSNTSSANKAEGLYQLLSYAQRTGEFHERETWLHRALEHCQQEPQGAHFKHPSSFSTPLHLAVKLMDSESGKTETLFQVIKLLLSIHPKALAQPDAEGHIPLHYAVAPSMTPQEAETQSHVQQSAAAAAEDLQQWKTRASILEHIVDVDPVTAREYLSQNNIIFQHSANATGGCTPLYRVLQTIPDDFDQMGPTVEYTAVVQSAYSKMVGVGNSEDGDKPLALLYRRFTRQFDISEKFFAGDNSRPEVVNHRKRYKAAAGNTWKIIELLLRPDTEETHWGIVHRAVQVETPPDLLRYIVETNAQDLTRVDKEGNLPLHHAAKSKPPAQLQLRTSENGGGSPTTTTTTETAEDKHRQFPAFYTKYVVDELLYKFPEGASMPDADGNFSLTLAIQSGKQWIGGGIKSLYDAYPDALKQIDLQEHQSLQRALSMGNDEERVEDNDDDDDEPPKKVGTYPGEMDGIIKDEHHDAIMLVQQPDVDISEVATSMWAHEEDAGVQMLGCVAIARIAEAAPSKKEVLRIALAAVAAVVNAMKAHPNEMIVQEKACHALKHLATADGHREVSMVASGAVAAIVGAMQAHVGDPGVQEEACAAVAAIVREGGADRATVVASVSGVTAIINAIAAHPTVAGVQLYGCHALKEMTEFENANLPELPRTQTEPLLTAAKKQFPQCSEAADIVLSRMS
jgi:hypothetical protein